jgi:hypothetical protein
VSDIHISYVHVRVGHSPLLICALAHEKPVTKVMGFFVSEFYNSVDGSVTYVAVKPMSERSGTLPDF